MTRNQRAAVVLEDLLENLEIVKKAPEEQTHKLDLLIDALQEYVRNMIHVKRTPFSLF